MKDEFEELKSTPVDEVDSDKSNEETEWKFDGEAYTQNETLLENGEIEISIPASEPITMPAEKPKPKRAEASEKVSTKKKPDPNRLKFALVAVAVAVCIAVLSVLGVFYYGVPNSDERMNPGNVAMRVNDTDVSIGMYNYYYTCVSQRYITYAQYGYYPDLDTSKDYSEQTTTDEKGDKITWADMFVNDTINQLKYITSFYEKAVEAGTTLSEEQKKQIDEQLESLKDTASENDQSVDDYISSTYGDYCGYATLKKMLEQCYLAENYYQESSVTQAVEDKELNEYFEAHKKDYIAVPFAYIGLFFDGEDVTQAQAEKKAKKYESQITTVNEMKKAIPKACSDTITAYVAAGYYENAKDAAVALAQSIETSITNSDTSFTEEGCKWLFDENTKPGECKSFTDVDNGIVFLLLKTGKPDVQKDEVYSVRHILVMPKDKEGNVLKDPTTGTKKQFAQAEKDAKAILAEFNKGDKSEVSFAKLAEEKSDDVETTSSGSSGIYGGLCEGTRLGTMVKPFENWSIDKARKYGDVDIVKSKFGYHIVFFVEDTQLYLYNCKKAILQEKENDLVDSASVKQRKSGMKKTIVAKPQAQQESEGNAYDDDSDNMDY